MALYLLSFRDERDEVVVAVVSSEREANKVILDREVAIFLREKNERCRCGRMHSEDSEGFEIHMDVAAAGYRLELLPS